MIQIGSKLKIADNTGARLANCIKIVSGYRKKSASVGDIILVSIKKFRSKRRDSIKVKSGLMYKALVIQIKKNKFLNNGNSYISNNNSIVLMSREKNKVLGTRIFGTIYENIRYTAYSKLIYIAVSTFDL